MISVRLIPLMPRFNAFILVFGLAMATAACSTGGGSGWGPVDYREGSGYGRGLSNSGNYTVQRGDTIYGIAREHDVSVRALIDANGLQPPYQLTVGQVLSLPGGGGYVVTRGDTLTGVARKTGVPFSTLARMNDLSAPYILKVGQRLRLPAGGEGSAGVAAPPPVETQRLAQAGAPPAPPPPVAPPPSHPATAERQGGYSPVGERDARPAGDAAAGSGAVPAVPAASGPPPAAEQRVAAASPPAPLPAPPPKSGRGFIWPVKGDVISEFGSTGKGQHNDGINIAVPRGTPVVAADDGIVAYAGNELRGFGNLLLIKHADGWMTAYAHNDVLLVKRGDTVKRGQHIAKAGDSGGVSQPQLHFEVRQGTRAVDPMSVLGGKAVPAASQIDPPDPG